MKIKFSLWLFMALVCAASFAQPLTPDPLTITTTVSNGTVPGTNIRYTITATATPRSILPAGISDTGRWEWNSSFTEFVGNGTHDLTVGFSAPVPVNRIILGINSAKGSHNLAVSGGNGSVNDFNLTDGMTTFLGGGTATYNSSTGRFAVPTTNADHSLMIGSSKSTTISRLSLTSDYSTDGYTTFFGLTSPVNTTPTILTTTNGAIPGTSASYTITATGSERANLNEGMSDQGHWSWDQFKEFVGSNAQSLTINFNVPVPINRLAFGASSIGSDVNIAVSGGTATPADFDLVDGISTLDNGLSGSYDPLTGVMATSGPNQNLMIGSTSSKTVSQLVLTADNGVDGYSLFFALTNPPIETVPIELITTNGFIPGTTTSYSITATGTIRADAVANESDAGLWSWPRFQEFLGTNAQSLTVDFSDPVPIDRLVFGVNSTSTIAQLSVSGGTASVSDFDLSDGLTSIGSLGLATYNPNTGEFLANNNQSVMVGSTSKKTITQLVITADNGADGYTFFFGALEEQIITQTAIPTTSNGIIPGTSTSYTISATGSVRGDSVRRSSDQGRWVWNGFQEFLGTGAQSLTVDFSAPVPLNSFVFGVNSMGTTATLSISGGTASLQDFNLSDGLSSLGAKSPSTYVPATGEIVSPGNSSLMIGSNTTETITSFTITADNGADGYTLFFGAVEGPLKPTPITTAIANGRVSGTNIDYTMSGTGNTREIFSPGSSDADLWSWNNGFPEWVGVDQQSLTVNFSAPVPIDRIIFGANSIGVDISLSVSGGTATTNDFNLTDGISAMGTTPANFNSSTGLISATNEQGLMIGSSLKKTVTQISLTGNSPGDGMILFFGTTAETANLGVTKNLDTPSPYAVGQTLAYSILVTNQGPGGANNVLVSDTPNNLTIQSVVSNNCGSLPCTIPYLANGASELIIVTATIDTAGNFSNGITVSADEEDPDLTNNSDNTGNGGASVIAPVASNNSYTLLNNSNLTIDLQPDITAGGGTLDFTTLAITGPSNGTLQNNNDGTVLYTPAPGFGGLDQFTYTISDSNNATSNVALVNLSIQFSPQANDDSIKVNPGEVFFLTPIFSNDQDPDGVIDATLFSLGATSPTQGTLSSVGTLSLAYTPNPGASGSDSFSYVVSDNDGNPSNEATVTITLNQAPITTDEDLSVYNPTSNTVVFLTNAYDPDGTLDLTTVELIPGYGPFFGTVSLNPDGSADYTPDSSNFSFDTFSYTILDDNGAKSPITTVSLETYIHIPDANFKAALVSNFDVNGDGELRPSEATGVTSINVNNSSIQDLSGIEFFTDLQELRAAGNGLTSLPDFTSFTQLTLLDVSNNKLTSVGAIAPPRSFVTAPWLPTSLVELHVQSNLIDNVGDLSSLVNLQWFNANQNKIGPALNPSLLPVSLEQLELNWNKLEQFLDVAALSNLNYLDISFNKIAVLPSPLPIHADFGTFSSDVFILENNYLDGNACIALSPIVTRFTTSSATITYVVQGNFSLLNDLLTSWGVSPTPQLISWILVITNNNILPDLDCTP